MKWGQRQGMGQTVELGGGCPGPQRARIMETGCCTGGSSRSVGEAGGREIPKEATWQGYPRTLPDSGER